jgi:hypothetical protein
MKRLAAACMLCMLSLPGQALDFWQFPECAERYALFLDVKAARLSFKEGFETYYPEVCADLLPFPLPFSLGVYAKMPDPNLKSFGIRAGYHVNLGDESTDLYVLYAFDFGFVRNDLLVKYGDEKQTPRYYDFRIGVRRVFGTFFCLVLETDFKSRGITVGVSLKVN